MFTTIVVNSWSLVHPYLLNQEMDLQFFEVLQSLCNHVTSLLSFIGLSLLKAMRSCILLYFNSHILSPTCICIVSFMNIHLSFLIGGFMIAYNLPCLSCVHICFHLSVP